MPQGDEGASHEAAVLAWRRARVARLLAPDGWLSLAGKHFLHEGDHSVGADPGCDVVLPEGKAPARLGVLTLERGRATLRRGGDGGAPVEIPREPQRLQVGALWLELMERGDAFALRVRDTQSDARLRFPGIDYYPIDPRYHLRARLVPYAPHRRIDLAYETGTAEPYACPGVLVFDLLGVPCRLSPVLDGDRPRLFILFADQTNQEETYGAGRFLYARLPENDLVQLDFNQAWNPPCAFTPYALCPMTPAQNRLPLRVLAGELRPKPPRG